MAQDHLKTTPGNKNGTWGPGSGDSTLVDRLKQGQEWAWQTLMSQYQTRLLKIAYGITLDHEESREIVQDVFIKAMTGISGFRGESGLGSWLRKITVNLSLNWKRKWKRRFRWHHTPLTPETEFLEYESAARGETPETRLREKEEENALAQAVAGLPEKIRTAFVLATLEGLSYREISEILGVKEGTVSSRIHRARQMVLAELKDNHKIKRGTP